MKRKALLTIIKASPALIIALGALLVFAGVAYATWKVGFKVVEITDDYWEGHQIIIIERNFPPVKKLKMYCVQDGIDPPPVGAICDDADNDDTWICCTGPPDDLDCHWQALKELEDISPPTPTKAATNTFTPTITYTPTFTMTPTNTYTPTNTPIPGLPYGYADWGCNFSKVILGINGESGATYEFDIQARRRGQILERHQGEGELAPDEEFKEKISWTLTQNDIHVREYIRIVPDDGEVLEHSDPTGRLECARPTSTNTPYAPPITTRGASGMSAPKIAVAKATMVAAVETVVNNEAVATVGIGISLPLGTFFAVCLFILLRPIILRKKTK